jgi:hypothetical protein
MPRSLTTTFVIRSTRQSKVVCHLTYLIRTSKGDSLAENLTYRGMAVDAHGTFYLPVPQYWIWRTSHSQVVVSASPKVASPPQSPSPVDQTTAFVARLWRALPPYPA